MSIFKFKHFSVSQGGNVHKVGTDSMVLGAFIENNNPNTILDLGSGTGVLALIMAQRFQRAKVFAVEKELEAFNYCQKNFSNASFSNRITTIHSSISTIKLNRNFDLIVSNPPYFAGDLLSINEIRSAARHEHELSLKGWMSIAKSLLSDNGQYWMIFPSNRNEEVVSIAESLNLHLNKCISIYGKPNQLIRNIYSFSTSKKQCETISHSFTIRDNDGKYTTEYKLLTKDLHEDVAKL